MWQPTEPPCQWSSKRAPRPSDFAHYQAIQSFLEENVPRHARALGPAPGDLLQAGLETPVSGLFQLVAGRRIVSDSHVAGQINARRFSVVVLNFDLRREQDPYWLNFYLSPPLVEGLQRNYVLANGLDLSGPAKERPEDRLLSLCPAARSLRHGKVTKNDVPAPAGVHKESRFLVQLKPWPTPDSPFPPQFPSSE